MAAPAVVRRDDDGNFAPVVVKRCRIVLAWWHEKQSTPALACSLDFHCSTMPGVESEWHSRQALPSLEACGSSARDTGVKNARKIAASHVYFIGTAKLERRKNWRKGYAPIVHRTVTCDLCFMTGAAYHLPACAPPSTCKTSPVTKAAFSKYNKASTISCTVPNL